MMKKRIAKEQLAPGILALRKQILRESERIKNRTKEDVIKELEDEIKQYEELYGGPFEVVFQDVFDPDALAEPDDFYNWRDALKELNALKKTLLP
ncbi:hypothetical protein [Peribacillus deserti]|uniref:Uncharacterized protein n=1 Tax=Peribacillus deserti TaxID=673318 RepID=A0A2N5M502_9BACI|nr:hypothetical protein [Peribacillus deserti]PLT29444.1 hypothetical protein CUU66_13155 [Peribacillus deserti]